MSLSNGSLAPGTVIDDKFRIEKVLGEGAVGIVVRALHLKLGTPVALKFLLPRMLGDAIVVERFAREARAAARMTSEHVARVLDVGNVQQGAPYMVMEYLSGETLGDAMKRRRIIPVSESCSYMMQVCDALTEAHALGIIHRDLKPANLFLSVRPNGKTVVKVLDFGISKMGGAVASTASADSNMKMPMPPEGDELTMASSILGTPLYMAPEQISSSRTVDGRADIWSCGIVLHRMLCGQVPFDAGSLIELGAKLIKERPPRLDKLRPDIPSDLANLVIKCLERDVARRWQSAADLAHALSRWVVSSTSGASPAVALEDDERPGDLTLAIRQAAKIPPAADQAETMTIVSGTARTVAVSGTVPSALGRAPPPPAPAEPPLERFPPERDRERERERERQRRELELEESGDQEEIIDITLRPVPVTPPPPVLGVKRRSKPAPVLAPPPPVAFPPPRRDRPLSIDSGEIDPNPRDETRVASHAPMIPMQGVHPIHPMHQEPMPMHHQQSGSYPPPPDVMGSRSAPTVPAYGRPPGASGLDQIEKHPYFGVGMVVLLGVFIFVILLFARQQGCL